MADITQWPFRMHQSPRAIDTVPGHDWHVSGMGDWSGVAIVGLTQEQATVITETFNFLSKQIVRKDKQLLGIVRLSQEKP